MTVLPTLRDAGAFIILAVISAGAAPFAFAGPASASGTVTAAVHSPGRGDPDRKAILDAFRPAVEQELGKPVEFVVSELNVAGNLAFVAVNAQRPGGGRIDPNHTPFAARNGEEALSMFDCCHAEAMLRKEQGQWRVVESGVGATDVWYAGWCDRVPRGLIGICATLTE